MANPVSSQIKDIEALFTRSDGTYLFARWGRPIAPVVFGVQDITVSVFKGALEAVVALAGHELAEMDPELGVNMMVFFVQDWAELPATPNLDRLIPELPQLVDRLIDADANQYRIFRFDPDGAIKAAFLFIRMDHAMNSVPAERIALSQIIQSIVLWSDEAFLGSSPLAVLRKDGPAVLKPEIAAVIRAGYDPVLPVAANDPSHAMRLAARIGAVQ
jgi:hypothetical protein